MILFRFLGFFVPFLMGFMVTVGLLGWVFEILRYAIKSAK